MIYAGAAHAPLALQARLSHALLFEVALGYILGAAQAGHSTRDARERLEPLSHVDSLGGRIDASAALTLIGHSGRGTHEKLIFAIGVTFGIVIGVLLESGSRVAVVTLGGRRLQLFLRQGGTEVWIGILRRALASHKLRTSQNLHPASQRRGQDGGKQG